MSINANNAALNEILEAINELPSSKEEQSKAIDITENGTTVVTPDEGKTLGEVTVNVEVESSDNVPENAVYQVDEYTDNGYIKTLSYKIPSNLPQDTIPNHAMRADVNSLLTKNIEEIIVDSNPTKIGQYAFSGLSGLKKVSCYDELITVGKGAFSSVALNYNYLPPNIETIDADAFANCQNFVFTEIPASIKTIGLDAFYSNGRLTEIRFKGTPTSLSGRAFQNCGSIKNIYVPWAEGTNVEGNAPWGATNATIHYNTTYDANGNPECPCHPSTEV